MARPNRHVEDEKCFWMVRSFDMFEGPVKGQVSKRGDADRADSVEGGRFRHVVFMQLM